MNVLKFARKIKQLDLTVKIIGLCLFIFTIWFWVCLPKPLFNKPYSFVIESKEGELLDASIAADGQWRFPETDSVPEKFKACIIAFEDQNFYSHPGVDIFALGRAIKQNVTNGRIVSGASTLNMQLIRLAEGNKRTWYNKILEAIKAVRLEFSYSKNEILKIYAANAPLGSNVVGLDAASWRYYGRNATLLSWGEMAALAVLPNAPALVHPGKNRERLALKRNRLIDLLLSEKRISATEAKLAKLEPLPDKPYSLPKKAPHLLNLLKSDYKSKKIPITRIRSSISMKLQQQVSHILMQHHQRLKANQVNNCAAIVLDVESGATMAYVANIYNPSDKELESHVDVIQAPRSPGSTLKPLLYAAMLNDGMILPHSLVPDIPTQIAGYQPNNYDLGYDGAVPASKALARSLNVPAVKMLQQYRYERFYSFLKSMGISTLTQPPDFYGLSLILGGCETTMWQLSGVYASMARCINHYQKNKGEYNRSDWHEPVYQHLYPSKMEESEIDRFIDASSIYYTFEAMNEVMRPGEELLWKQFTSSQQIAWKTGTSFGFRDAWAIGATPQFVVAVWAGNTNGEGRPGLTGIDAAAPILFDIFHLLPSLNKSWFEPPTAEMKPFDVCKNSGFKASQMCVETKRVLLPAACIRAPVCSFHQWVHLDRSGSYQLSSDCESPINMIHKSWFVLPPAMGFYYKAKNYSYHPLPPFRPGCHGEVEKEIELIYPQKNAKIFIPVDLDGQKEQIIFNAAHESASEEIFWHIDNMFIGKTREIHKISITASPGVHTITLIDSKGAKLQQSFTIVSSVNKN